MSQQSLITEAINSHAQQHPKQIALHSASRKLTYPDLQLAIEQQVQIWQSFSGNTLPTIALAIENSPAWVILDLAALECKIPVIPLPFFFSPAQWLHAIHDAGATFLITDSPEKFEILLAEQITQRSHFELAGQALTQFKLNTPHKVNLPSGTAKITYTSGTTGHPKGVCLSTDHMLKVAKSIADATRLSAKDSHLNVLPLATLLENIAGVYSPLLVGASCVLLPNKQIGLSGSTGLDVKKLVNTLNDYQATTVIFTPELLHALTLYMEDQKMTLKRLRFVAVGGASVSPMLLKQAHLLNIPVYEGYGLSECASVVTLNVPENNKMGSVGQVLPHVKIQFTDDHEIIVSRNTFLGYVGHKNEQKNFLSTGDIGSIDEDGFLFITGRKKNIFITSFGRNVSPEWVERELKISPHIAQAAIYGEAKPWNVAVIVPKPNATAEQIEKTIQGVNTALPDYARISRWIMADAPFSSSNEQLTSNGRNRRDNIWQHYQDKINALYEGSHA